MIRLIFFTSIIILFSFQSDAEGQLFHRVRSFQQVQYQNSRLACYGKRFSTMQRTVYCPNSQMAYQYPQSTALVRNGYASYQDGRMINSQFHGTQFLQSQSDIGSSAYYPSPQLLQPRNGHINYRFVPVSDMQQLLSSPLIQNGTPGKIESPTIAPLESDESGLLQDGDIAPIKSSPEADSNVPKSLLDGVDQENLDRG